MESELCTDGLVWLDDGGDVIEAECTLEEGEALQAMLEDHSLALRCVHVARMVEAAAYAVCGTEMAGRFLGAMADEAEERWPAESYARVFAVKLRQEIEEVIRDSLVTARALLRLMTRDGRLHPGLAPLLAGEFVSGERGDIS